ncbi:hypothetical protein [Streptomyces sp. URMC 124]|uniref:hypothetical protein n=1 Tax=Streptomyces sp. URMC 124 TaxID=3423405 RepID=UPI003F1B50FA
MRAKPHRSIRRKGDRDFDSPDEITPGLVVFDPVYDMVCRVKAVDGFQVELERPTGMTPWRRYFRKIRRATSGEARQLDALAKLHEARRRGLG